MVYLQLTTEACQLNILLLDHIRIDFKIDSDCANIALISGQNKFSHR